MNGELEVGFFGETEEVSIRVCSLCRRADGGEEYTVVVRQIGNGVVTFAIFGRVFMHLRRSQDRNCAER